MTDERKPSGRYDADGQEEHCESCYFAQRVREIDKPERLICRRHPPVLVVLGDDPENEGDFLGVWDYPVVGRHLTWCGEYRRGEPSTEADKMLADIEAALEG